MKPRNRAGFTLAEILVAASMAAATLLVMDVLYRFSAAAARTVSRRGKTLSTFSAASGAIKARALAASHLYLPNQDGKPLEVMAGHINAVHGDPLTPVDPARPSEFFYVCLAGAAYGHSLYLYTGELPKNNPYPLIEPCGSEVSFGRRNLLLSPDLSGDFIARFSRPVKPANQVKVTLYSIHPELTDWFNWSFTALTHQPATLDSPVFKL